MRAFVVTHYGPEGLQPADVPTPSVGPRDVLVDVRAASINPLDKMVRNGEFKQLLKYKRPFTLGHDVAGVITQVGPDVRGFKVGDEIYARPRDLRIGTFAEAIAVDAADVAIKPATLSFEEGSSRPARSPRSMAGARRPRGCETRTEGLGPRRCGRSRLNGHPARQAPRCVRRNHCAHPGRRQGTNPRRGRGRRLHDHRLSPTS